MSKASSALLEKAKISHGLELYSYFISRSLKKNLNIYHFENNLVSKYKAYKDYKLLEKELKDNSSTISSKKVVKLK